MSKKTAAINQSIQKLSQLQSQLEDFNRAQDSSSKELDTISFEMSQQIKNLKFLFESLYSYNGKSTSNAKKAASKENGKKGGRPLKAVTQARRRKIELNEKIIPELEHKLAMTSDSSEEKELKVQLENARKELEKL